MRPLQPRFAEETYKNMADAMKKVQAAVKSPSKGKIELYSKEYFAACTLGGIIGMFYLPSVALSTIFWEERRQSNEQKTNDLLQLAVQHIPWSLLSISSNAEDKSMRIFTPPTSEPGAPFSRLKVFVVSFLAGYDYSYRSFLKI